MSEDKNLETTEISEDEAVYVISIASQLSGMHPQTLRQYDRMGLVIPVRTGGKSRRYTMRNVAQLREIARLSAEGVSLEEQAEVAKEFLVGLVEVMDLEATVEIRTLDDETVELEIAADHEDAEARGQQQWEGEDPKHGLRFTHKFAESQQRELEERMVTHRANASQ